MKRWIVLMCLALVPTWLEAAEEPPEVVYEPGTPLNLPYQNCEIQTTVDYQDYSLQMPVEVKIFIYNPEDGSKLGPIVEETLTKPRALEEGYYYIEVKGQEKPIYVAYDVQFKQREYQLIRRDGEPVGRFSIPGIARMPSRGARDSYQLKFQDFETVARCRDGERAVIQVKGYKELPPFLEPAKGAAW